MRFAERLQNAWDRSGGMLCVGLDPDIPRMPDDIRASPRPVLAFNRRIVDLVGDLVCAFKPQFAHHAAVGAEEDLAQTIAYIRRAAPHALIILDAKRGDIGSTAVMYAREAFDRYDADCVTVNPLLGDDCVLPFLERADRGALILCRTSNPDAGRYQTLDAAGEPMFAAVARRAQNVWNARDNCMLVVGATAPADLALARAAAPGLGILVPGVGEQGGTAQEVMAAGLRADGRGLVVSASRSVIWAGDDRAIRAAAQALHRDLPIREPEFESA